MKEYGYRDHPLKHCPFCGSKASRTGGILGGIVIKQCRCSNDDCLASRCSTDFDTWNNRPSAREANKTTKALYEWGKAID